MSCVLSFGQFHQSNQHLGSYGWVGGEELSHVLFASKQVNEPVDCPCGWTHLLGPSATLKVVWSRCSLLLACSSTILCQRLRWTQCHSITQEYSLLFIGTSCIRIISKIADHSEAGTVRAGQLHGLLEVYSVFPFWHARNNKKRNLKDTLQWIEIRENVSPFAKIGPCLPARLDKIHSSILRKEFLKLSWVLHWVVTGQVICTRKFHRHRSGRWSVCVSG